jgi:hypothetical protein
MSLTLEEKRERVNEYCKSFGLGCDDCPYDTTEPVWCDKLDATDLSESELDKVIETFENHFNPKPEPDMVNHPPHYNREGAMETIDEMEAIFGTEATFHYCRLNSWKYRARSTMKNGDEDLKKSDWYIRKAAELKVKMKLESVYEQRATVEACDRL